VLIDYRNGYSFQSNIYFTRANQSDRVRKNAKLKDGSRKLLDDKGKEVLAEDGKVIMVDNFRNVTVRIYEFRQFKSCQFTAIVDYVNYKTTDFYNHFH
jgi:hypothetical protein